MNSINIFPSTSIRMNLLLTFFLALLLTCLIPVKGHAQRDTGRKSTIDITSSYKPVLRNAVKINLSATPSPADTSRPRLSYDIPAQNLFFSYQPIALKPLSLIHDTALDLGIRNYVKAGFGNFTTPYVKAGFSFGDGKTSLVNLYADHISSRGKIEHQNFREFSVKGIGSFFTATNEFYAGAQFSQHEYNQYGYDHALYNLNKASVLRRYQDIAIRGGMRNTAVNDANFNYHPNAEAHIFSRGDVISESSLLLDAPVEKKFGESVSFKLDARAELNTYTIKASSSPKKVNNLYQIAPELVFYSDRFTFHGGVTPSWANGELSVLPNIYGEAQLQNNLLMVQAGWVGRFRKNSVRSLSAINPYIDDPMFLKDTKEVEFYGGVKATLGKHFSFNAKAAYISYTNMPLYVNNFGDGKNFVVVNESKMSNFLIHGDLNFVSQDKFTLTAAADVNTYAGFRDNDAAWHLIPIQFTSSFRWHAFKQVLIKGDLFTFSRVPALVGTNTKKILPGGTDLSAGGEFKITDMFSAWLDFNNILNSKYTRWNNYPVYGLNVIGGVIVHF